MIARVIRLVTADGAAVRPAAHPSPTRPARRVARWLRRRRPRQTRPARGRRARLARLAERPRSIPLALAVTVTLGAAAATVSRAAALALAAGLVVLAATQGPRALARTATGPLLGAVIIVAGLLPSMPEHAPACPLPAALGLLIALSLVYLLHTPRQLAAATVVTATTAIALTAGPLRTRLATLSPRLTITSTDRADATTAALHRLTASPAIGAGPGPGHPDLAQRERPAHHHSLRPQRIPPTRQGLWI